MSLRSIIAIAVASSVAGCAAAPKGQDISYYLSSPSSHRLVQVMSGKTDLERLAAVTQALQAKGIPFKLEDFSTQRASGKNLTFEYGSGKKVVVISAHYDSPPGSPGANDDASCIASMIEAYGNLKSQGPLENITARFIVFGAEEIQRQGSRAYVNSTDLQNVIGAASFEMCGIGDTIAVWGAEGATKNSQMVGAIEKTAKDGGIHYGIVGNIPRFYSDHVSFAERGIPAVGVTIVPREDEAVLREYIGDPNAFRWIRVSSRPTVFQTYHTENDTADTIQPSALAMGARVIQGTIKNLDSALKPAK